MPRLTDDSLMLIKASATATDNAEVTALTGWTDLSPELLTGAIDETAEVITTLPHGSDNRGEPLAGAKSGTITGTFQASDGGTPDPAAALREIWDTPGRRMAFAVQLDRSALLDSSNPPAVVPAASAANPQHVGNAVLTALNTFGNGGAGSVQTVNFSAQISRGYKVLTS